MLVKYYDIKIILLLLHETINMAKKLDKARKTIDLSNEYSEKVRVKAFEKKTTPKGLLEQIVNKEIAKWN